jgi:hypothetical protein
MRRWLRHALVCALLAGSAVAVTACEGAVTEVDARFSTPEHTVRTLFGAYGVEDLSQQEIRDRMTTHGRFELRDRESYLACFADLETTADEGLAGFVFGALAAGKDELRTTITNDRATVSPRENMNVVLLRGEDGRWRISLRESVPDEVRTRLGVVAADAERRERRGISTGARVE